MKGLFFVVIALSILSFAVAEEAPNEALPQLVPEGFSCTKDMPRHSPIYSIPPNANSARVHLIHVFCGQVTERYGVGGFHARPGDVDPESVQTTPDMLKRTPANEFDFSMYRKPRIYDIEAGGYVTKSSSSSVWPTILSMNELTVILTYLVDRCKPPSGKHLCVSNFSILPPDDPDVIFFDVRVIILQDSEVGRVILTSYPVKQGSCARMTSTSYAKCDYAV